MQAPDPVIAPNQSINQLVKLLLGGQLIALFITGTGIFSQLLAERNVSLPTCQSFLNYALLSLFCLPLYQRWQKKKQAYQQSLHRANSSNNQSNNQSANSEYQTPLIDSQSSASDQSTNQSINQSISQPDGPPKLLSTHWYIYLGLAFLDVEGNALLVTAYDYTNITSVQLLDCFTVPLVMVLSFFLLRTRFNKQHMLGTALCLAGVSTLVISDLYIQSLSTDSRNALLGDAFVLLGCLCYAISNLAQEHIVKNADACEWLAMIGVFGTLVSGCQVLIFEREGLMALTLDTEITSYFIGFVICMFSVYLIVPRLLQHSSAVFLNLSLLTSDFWAVLAGYLIFHVSLHFMYFVAFILIVIGLIMYNLAATSMAMKWLTKTSDLSHPISIETGSARAIEMRHETSLEPTQL